MFKKIIENFHDLQDHHQILFSLIIAFCIISVTWGVEKILETYLFPKKPIYGYLIAILAGLITLWIAKHFLLQEI